MSQKKAVFFMPLLITLALGAVFFTAIGEDPTELETARLNDPVPAFTLEDLKKPSVHVNEKNLVGQAALMNVWATWCPSCKVEHPYLVDLAKRGVPIIGLNYKDERNAAIRWLDQLGDPYSINIYDPKGSLGFDLGVYGAPETYVIDAYGVVRHRHVGVVNEKVWMETLKPLLDKLNKPLVPGGNS